MPAETVLEQLRAYKAFLMPPCDRAVLDGAFGFGLPADYKEFLALANGAQAPGILLRGTELQTLAGGQPVPDIFMATMEAREEEHIDTHTHDLGYMSAGLVITHSEKDNVYRILDSSECHMVYREYATLEELVAKWAERKPPM